MSQQVLLAKLTGTIKIHDDETPTYRPRIYCCV